MNVIRAQQAHCSEPRNHAHTGDGQDAPPAAGNEGHQHVEATQGRNQGEERLSGPGGTVSKSESRQSPLPSGSDAGTEDRGSTEGDLSKKPSVLPASPSEPESKQAARSLDYKKLDAVPAPQGLGALDGGVGPDGQNLPRGGGEEGGAAPRIPIGAKDSATDRPQASVAAKVIGVCLTCV